MNDKTKVQMYADRAVNASPKEPQDYIDIAFIYLDMNKTQDALATLSSGILKYPYERKLYNEKLKILQKVGNTKDYNLLKIQMNNKFPKETVYLGK